MKKQEIIEQLKKKLDKAIERNIANDEKIGVLFSGGVDSSLLAYMAKQKGKEVRCYSAALNEGGLSIPKDLESSQEVAKKYNFYLKVRTITLGELEKIIPKVMNIIKSSNVVKVGVAIPLYLSMELAEEDSISYLLSGIGSEEIFAGYERHAKANDINKECIEGLKNIKKRDLDRDNSIAKHFHMELRTPLLDDELVEFALNIPGKYKIAREQNKLILRETAMEIGLDEKTSMLKKRGAQYGSGFDKGLQKLAKKKGFKFKSEYLNSLNVLF